MASPPIRTASHFGLWAFTIGIVIFLSWSAVNKKSSSENYSKGATHIEPQVTNNYYPLTLPFGGCQYVRPDGKLLKNND